MSLHHLQPLGLSSMASSDSTGARHQASLPTSVHRKEGQLTQHRTSIPSWGRRTTAKRLYSHSGTKAFESHNGRKQHICEAGKGRGQKAHNRGTNAH